jgi:molybdopterin-guanine dinucleotide biosynthesis adapter protein
MKVFSVIGITKSGKTTTVENIITELKKRRFSVGSVKEIHFEEFAMDQEGTNTHRHKVAGSELVTARGFQETDVLYQGMLAIDEILKHYHHEYVVLEGSRDTNCPKIITAHTIEEVDERLDETVFAISGVLSNTMKEYKGIPVINATTDIESLVDFIEEKVFEKLPDFPAECCSECGYAGCRDFGGNILKGNTKREQCTIMDSNVKLSMGGRQVEMVPFVQKLLNNAVLGVVKELNGYESGSPIEIKIG